MRRFVRTCAHRKVGKERWREGWWRRSKPTPRASIPSAKSSRLRPMVLSLGLLTPNCSSIVELLGAHFICLSPTHSLVNLVIYLSSMQIVWILMLDVVKVNTNCVLEFVWWVHAIKVQIKSSFFLIVLAFKTCPQ